MVMAKKIHTCKYANLQAAVDSAASLAATIDEAIIAEAQGHPVDNIHALFSAGGWDQERVKSERHRAASVVANQAMAGTEQSRARIRKKISDGAEAHLAEKDLIAAFLEAHPFGVGCHDCLRLSGILTIDAVRLDESPAVLKLRHELSASETAVEYLKEPRALPSAA